MSDTQLELDIRDAVYDVIGKRLEDNNAPRKEEVVAILIDIASRSLWQVVNEC